MSVFEKIPVGFKYYYFKKNFSKVTPIINSHFSEEHAQHPATYPAMTESDVIDNALEDLVNKTMAAPATAEDAIDIQNRLDVLGGQIERTAAHLMKTVKSQEQARMYSMLRLVNNRMNGLAEKVREHDKLSATVRKHHRELAGFPPTSWFNNLQHIASDHTKRICTAEAHVDMCYTDCYARNEEHIRVQRDMHMRMNEHLDALVAVQAMTLAQEDKIKTIQNSIAKMEEDIKWCNDKASQLTYDLHYTDDQVVENGNDLKWLVQSVNQLREGGLNIFVKDSPPPPPSC